MKKIAKARLADIDVEEVSYVDKAANKRKFLFIKRDTSSNEGGDNLILMKRFAKNNEVIKAIEGMEASLAALEKAIKTEIEKKDNSESDKELLVTKQDEFEVFKAEMQDKIEELFLDKADDSDEEEEGEEEEMEEEYKGKKPTKKAKSSKADESEETDSEEDDEEVEKQDEEEPAKPVAKKVEPVTESEDEETETEVKVEKSDEDEDDEDDEMTPEEQSLLAEIEKEVKEVVVLKDETRKTLDSLKAVQA